ncbi:heme peroxidase [Lasiosphaeris hirsuta]|uniref:Peroxidase n=1 Tax=Lasiosphaeris hirsuta TaxID=260670 RepID=A0AA39ZPI5_9PEZI|nr:heme peroxidase [Lasiosphaeris hirsuta]
MKLLAFIGLYLAGAAVAFPSIKELKVAAWRRQFLGSTELPGDLATLAPGELSSVGAEIRAILLGQSDGQGNEGYSPPALDSAECRQDECCVWKHVADELYGLMHDAATGTCNDFARGAIRMGFHDAAAWDKFSSWGGADGSLLLSDELLRPENAAMAGVGAKMKGLYEGYTAHGFGISMADLLQCGAKVGVLACPGGPRIRMFVGRPSDATPAPLGRLPPATFTADQIIDLFADKMVSPSGIVTLIGAHTASRNHNVTANPPQDATPGRWDTDYFSEHLRPNASTGVFRFPSDVSLAQSPRTRPLFEQFSAAKGSWDKAYAAEYIRMSLMGVKSINTLRECTKAMPKGDKTVPSEPPADGNPQSPSPSHTTATEYQSSTATIASFSPGESSYPDGSRGHTTVPVNATVYEVKPTTGANANASANANATHEGPDPAAKSVPITAEAGCIKIRLSAVAAACFLAALL